MTKEESLKPQFEDWMLSEPVVVLHPLAPSIPLHEWNQYSEEQRKQMEQRIFTRYEQIQTQQLETHRKAEAIREKYKKFPFWKKLLCILKLHKRDTTMKDEHLCAPRTFARLIFCKRCGHEWYG